MLNKVCLLGRMCSDAELRTTPGGASVTSFTLAVPRSYVKQGAERETDFIDIVAWRNTAEFVCKYFRKGQMMALEGSIQTRSYTDKEGNKRKAFEILANNVYFTESKGGKAADISVAPVAEEAYDTDGFAVVSDDGDLPF